MQTQCCRGRDGAGFGDHSWYTCDNSWRIDNGHWTFVDEQSQGVSLWRDVEKMLWDSGCQAPCSLCIEKGCTTSCQEEAPDNPACFPSCPASACHPTLAG